MLVVRLEVDENRFHSISLKCDMLSRDIISVTIERNLNTI